MSKTVTIRLDEEAYNRIKAAAKEERRPISNYIEHATLSYLEEMTEILSDSDLLGTLRKSLQDVKTGKYRIV